MKKFNADDALKGAPVKLKNGLKAYIEKYCEDNVFVYSGHIAGERGEVKSWNRQGKEYFNRESPYDIVAMWGDEEQEDIPEANAQANLEANAQANLEANTEDNEEANTEANAQANLEANSEANLEANTEANTEAEENIFEKALRNNLQLRCRKQDFEKYYYCIAKTENIDYLLENKKDGTIERLSSFIEGLDWSVVEHKIPKAFMPKEDEEFWFIHTMKNKTVASANYCDNDVYYNGLASAGLAFRTKEEATQALHFLRNNIEVNNGEEQK